MAAKNIHGGNLLCAAVFT